MTEGEERVIYRELWELFMRTNTSFQYGLTTQQKVYEIVRNDVEEEVDAEDEVDLHAPDKLKVIEELQLRWRFSLTIYQDLKAIAEILHYSDLLPIPPELDFSDVRRGWIFDSDFDIIAFIDKIDDFEQELADLCTSWTDDVEP